MKKLKSACLLACCSRVVLRTSQIAPDFLLHPSPILPHSSFQSQSFPAGQTALQLPHLGLPVAELRSLRLPHARVDLRLPARVADQAALPLYPLVGLVQLLAELLDLRRQVHSALDLEEYGRRRADGRYYAAGRFRRGRVQDRERRGRANLTGKGADRGELRCACFKRRFVEKLNVERGRVFDRVLGRDGTNGLGDGEKEFVGSFRGRVVELRVMTWVRCFDNGGRGVIGPTGKALPELFGEERHEGVDHCESAFESGVEGLLGRFLLRGGTVLNESLGVFNIDIAEVCIPVLISDRGRLRKFAGSEGTVDFGGGSGEFVENPALRERFLVGFCGMSLWSEGIVQFSQDIFGGLVDFVAEFAVAMHHFYVKIDVAPCLNVSIY